MLKLKSSTIILISFFSCLSAMPVNLHKKKLKNYSVSIGLISRVDTLRYFQLNLITSAASRVEGLQLSGISNVTGALRGVQIGAFSNISLSPVSGLQFSPITNISTGIQRGVQMSALVNVCSGYMRGYQQGTYNYADTLTGVQLGIINACVAHKRGVQIGLINCSRDTTADKIGLVNVNPHTKIDIMAFAGTSSKFNFAFRFRNRSTYSIVGMGTHYMGLDKRFSGTIYYRLGQYFELSPKWSISGDVGFFHIETFQQNSDLAPQRLYSIQLRVNADYQVNQMFGIFASLGYGDTRYYNDATEYRNRALVEIGTSFRLKIRNER